MLDNKGSLAPEAGRAQEKSVIAAQNMPPESHGVNCRGFHLLRNIENQDRFSGKSNLFLSNSRRTNQPFYRLRFEVDGNLTIVCRLSVLAVC